MLKLRFCGTCAPPEVHCVTVRPVNWLAPALPSDPSGLNWISLPPPVRAKVPPAMVGNGVSCQRFALGLPLAMAPAVISAAAVVKWIESAPTVKGWPELLVKVRPVKGGPPVPAAEKVDPDNA